MAYQEFPKWLHREGHESVLVQSADAEAAQLAVWGAPKQTIALPEETAVPQVTGNRLTASDESLDPRGGASNLGDWDSDGRPGGSVPSTKPENALTTARRGGGWPKGKPRAKK